MKVIPCTMLQNLKLKKIYQRLKIGTVLKKEYIVLVYETKFACSKN